MLLTSACSQSIIPTITPTIPPTGILTPYHTTTPPLLTPTATLAVVIPVTPAPTPTPFLHTIAKDETMLGIAYQYGVSLEELQAANPGVDPHFLSVGKQLIIPLGGELPQTLPTPTPIALQLTRPRCFRSGDGGAWCILAVHNDLDSNVENLSAWMGLFTPQGENIANQIIYAPLNLLVAGATIPLMAYFAPPLPEQVVVSAELLSGIFVPQGDSRYVGGDVSLDALEIAPDGRSATLSGIVNLPVDTPQPSQVWILTVAYDADGYIIGGRKWESTGESQFKLTVYTLAGTIDHVDVLTEARP
ncbi:MAG: hypothetical protein A2136_04490 [Chloroflexi bacterium RBG_16_54_11]|nr:MAG: hypothetical protein A2136_04490 [Chloroflexi bacterium RBG_16_54_11]